MNKKQIVKREDITCEDCSHFSYVGWKRQGCDYVCEIGEKLHDGDVAPYCCSFENPYIKLSSVYALSLPKEWMD